MIKLNRNFTPVCLHPTFVKAGSEKFRLDKNSRVWAVDDLKSALMELSYDKCAYCECKLSTGPNYMEVEHFIDKDNNPDLVLAWNNLLPSCKRCNGTKGTHDVQVDPIVNPCIDTPMDHLQFKLGRMRGKTDVGRSTIDVVGLNHTKRAVQPRFKIAEAIMGLIDDCLIYSNRYIENPNTRAKNNLLRKVECLLEECLPNAEYSATAATVLHNDPDYIDLKNQLIAASLWPTEFDNMEIESRFVVLDLAS